MEPYEKNFRMYSYITSELVEVVNANFPGKSVLVLVFNNLEYNNF